MSYKITCPGHKATYRKTKAQAKKVCRKKSGGAIKGRRIRKTKKGKR